MARRRQDPDHGAVGFRRSISTELVVAAHRDVVPAHADERRPDADVGDPHLAVADRLRLHHLPGLPEAARVEHPEEQQGPASLRLALVVLGVAMLVVGIGYHVIFMYGLREERAQLKADGLIHAESQFPAFAHADGGGPAARDRRAGHREHGVRRRTFRLRRFPQW